jgi:predicted nuclease of restriction endonuclease-like (RecB) superfamily
MTADHKYIKWLGDIKSRLRNSQIKASVQINVAMLEFNWALGKDLVEMKAEQMWGAGVIKQLSLDLRAEFPEIKGLSVDNLYFMRRWFEFYAPDLNATPELFDQAGQISQMPPIFGLIPWRHHIEIIKKCRNVKEALFYIHQTIENNWSRSMLEANLKSALYQNQGKALTNFSAQGNLPQGNLAQEILKDPYDFNFLKMRQGYSEYDFESALVTNITRFLLELGQGFAFVGRQMELRMPNGKAYFPDLLFYHTRLKCFVVIELKIVDFIPEFVGKLNFYVSAVDELLKQKDDNPSIGLLICKSHDKTTVEWSFRGVDRPIGVASYQLEEVVKRTIEEVEQKKEKKGGEA